MTMRMLLALGLVAASAPVTPTARALEQPGAVLLASGLGGGTGSTVGPDGALYVTEGGLGRISRVDPETGAINTFASGLPPALIGLGGVTDVVFIGHTAYALVTLVGPEVGGTHIDGIYRIDGPSSFTVLANIGQFALDNPPRTPFDVPTGLQFAIEPFRDGFLVSDGHHNRVLRVTLDGRVTEQIAFDNIVPTGMAIRGNTIYLAQAGPVPHLPENGKVVSFGAKSATATEVASGARLVVDVEFGRGRTLFALSQGVFPAGNPPGSPALPNTGALVQATAAGTFEVVTDGLNLPTSLEIIGNTAYVYTLTGEVRKIEGIAEPPYGQ